MPYSDPERAKESLKKRKRTYYLRHREKCLKRAKEDGYKRRKRIRALINAFKDRPCTDCGIKYPLCAMQFDHVIGEKKFNIAHFGRRPDQELMEEIAKCEVVCANCHAIRTHTRRSAQ